MTQINSPAPSGELAVAARKLDEFDAALAQLIAQTKSRNRLLFVGSILSLVLIVVYLGYAYARFGGEVTPDLVANNAQAQFEQYVPQAAPQLEEQLKQAAPRVVDGAIGQLRTLPEQFAEKLKTEAAKRMDDAMPAVEDSLYKSLKSALDNAKSNGPGEKAVGDEERMKSMLTALGEVYGQETTRFVKQVHAEYATQAVDFVNYLDKLASDPNLDRQQQMQRAMVRDALALVRVYDFQAKNGKGAALLSTAITEPVK